VFRPNFVFLSQSCPSISRRAFGLTLHGLYIRKNTKIHRFLSAYNRLIHKEILLSPYVCTEVRIEDQSPARRRLERLTSRHLSSTYSSLPHTPTDAKGQDHSKATIQIDVEKRCRAHSLTLPQLGSGCCKIPDLNAFLGRGDRFNARNESIQKSMQLFRLTIGRDRIRPVPNHPPSSHEETSA
jgi:hypothetical protein